MISLTLHLYRPVIEAGVLARIETAFAALRVTVDGDIPVQVARLSTPIADISLSGNV